MILRVVRGITCILSTSDAVSISHLDCRTSFASFHHELPEMLYDEHKNHTKALAHEFLTKIKTNYLENSDLEIHSVVFNLHNS